MMRTRITMAALLAVSALLPHGVQASATQGIDALLAQAEQVRSVDPARFERLMLTLHERRAQASPAQRDQIGYLDAYAHAIRGNYDEAITRAGQLLEQTQDPDTAVRAGALLVNNYALTKRYTEGMRQLEATLLQLEADVSAELREQVYGVAAVIHNQAGQYLLGRRYAERVLDDTQSERARCYAGQTRLEAMHKLRDPALKEADFTANIDQCLALNEAVVANLTRTMLARRWADAGTHAEAITLLKTHLEEVEATRYGPLVGEFRALLAAYEWEVGNLEAADTHAALAVALMEGSGNLSVQADAYRIQYLVASARGLHDQALRYYRAHVDADRAYLNEVAAREMAYQVVRQEGLQQAQQIELLNQRNTVLALEQHVASQKARSNGLLALLLVVLVATTALWAYRVKRVQVRLRRMTEVDALTGICNRHHFSLLARKTLVSCTQADEPAALVMFDLDHFKQINDRHGHAAGDWVLVNVARLVGRMCRPVDCFGRLGGEEFAIVLPGCDARAARRFAQDVLATLRGMSTSEAGFLMQVSASFGVTDTVLSGSELAHLMSHADRAMYRAKNGGRGCVQVYEPERVAHLYVAARNDAGPTVPVPVPVPVACPVPVDAATS